MSNFKKRALKALYDWKENECGPGRSMIMECIDLIQNLPDDENTGEKCAISPDWEAECEKLQKALTVRERAIDILECDLKDAEARMQTMGSTIARLEGFKEGILTGLRVSDTRTVKNELRQGCERKEY